MRRTILISALGGSVLAGSAAAEVPRVATDIAPVHGLVARVMQGVGSPDLVVRPGASPHGYSLRPSEALALEQADVVFWIGEALTPWLEGSIDKLASDAHVVELLAVPGATTLAFREGVLFEHHDHAEEGDHKDEHGDDHAAHEGEGHDHAEHSEHAEGHDSHKEHDAHHEAHEKDERADHGHANHGHEEHPHDGVDPHAWLAPVNGKLWLDVIAEELAEHDPANAATYAANAAAGKAEIDAVVAELQGVLAPVKQQGFVVFHDAYQYFETSFGMTAVGSISLGDASDPSPARIAEIRHSVAELKVGCVFSEPQFNAGLVTTVLEGTGAGTAILDPMGVALDTGPEFYPELLRSLGQQMARCN